MRLVRVHSESIAYVLYSQVLRRGERQSREHEEKKGQHHPAVVCFERSNQLERTTKLQAGGNPRSNTGNTHLANGLELLAGVLVVLILHPLGLDLQTGTGRDSVLRNELGH